MNKVSYHLEVELKIRRSLNIHMLRYSLNVFDQLLNYANIQDHYIHINVLIIVLLQLFELNNFLHLKRVLVVTMDLFI